VSSFEANEYCDEVDCAQERVGEFVVSGCNGPEVLDCIEEPFNQIAFPIKGEVSLSWSDPVGFCRDDGDDCAFFKRADQSIRVIGFIREEGFRAHFFKQWLRLADVTGLSGCQ